MEISDRKLGRSTCHKNLGTVFEFLGDYVKAKGYLEKALEIRLKVGDRTGAASSCGKT